MTSARGPYRPPLQVRRAPPTRNSSWSAVAAALFLFTLGFFAWQWLAYGWAVGVDLLLIPLLTILTLPFLSRLARSKNAFDLAGIEDVPTVVEVR
jgi:hypothetical protein